MWALHKTERQVRAWAVGLGADEGKGRRGEEDSQADAIRACLSLTRANSKGKGCCGRGPQLCYIFYRAGVPLLAAAINWVDISLGTRERRLRFSERKATTCCVPGMSPKNDTPERRSLQGDGLIDISPPESNPSTTAVRVRGKLSL